MGHHKRLEGLEWAACLCLQSFAPGLGGTALDEGFRMDTEGECY
jgi:hypothetical protein